MLAKVWELPLIICTMQISATNMWTTTHNVLSVAFVLVVSTISPYLAMFVQECMYACQLLLLLVSRLFDIFVPSTCRERERLK